MIRKLETIADFVATARQELRNGLDSLHFPDRMEKQRSSRKRWSRLYKLNVILSPEVVGSYLVALIFLLLAQPFGTDRLDGQFAISLLIILSIILHIGVIFSTLHHFVYYVFFRFGLFTFVATTILFYSIAATLIAVALGVVLVPTLELDVPSLFIYALSTISAISILNVAKFSILEKFNFNLPDKNDCFKQLDFLSSLKKAIAVSACDHYIQLVKENQIELIRMNFADAIELLSNDDGIQIHRSHWVSYKGVAELTKLQNNQYQVVLVNGSTLPVSRSKLRETKFRLRNKTNVLD